MDLVITPAMKRQALLEAELGDDSRQQLIARIKWLEDSVHKTCEDLVDKQIELESLRGEAKTVNDHLGKRIEYLEAALRDIEQHHLPMEVINEQKCETCMSGDGGFIDHPCATARIAADALAGRWKP